MIVQGDNEKRVDYLLRVLKKYMEIYGEHLIGYDGDNTQNGDCIYEDLTNAIEDGERE